MAISCDPADLANQAKCLRCLPNRTIDSVFIYCLCTWANEGITPDDQIVLGDPELDFMFGDPNAGFSFGN